MKSELSYKEKTALAIVSSGRSYDESSKVTGVDIYRIMYLWTKLMGLEANKTNT